MYLKNSELLKEIIISKEKDELTSEAVRMFIILSNEISRKLRYKEPMDREDCVAFAIYDLLKYWRSFDPTKGTNAFAYYSQVAKAGLAKGWSKLHPKDTPFIVTINDIISI